LTSLAFSRCARAARSRQYPRRAVILAWAPTLDDDRTRLAYLQGLPITAWCLWLEYTAESIRTDTLAAIERGLKQLESL
jgi:hypothetical protein